MKIYAKLPDINELRKYLHYEPDLGITYWIRCRRSFMPRITPAGSLHYDGYCRLAFAGKIYLEHRIAWFMHTGKDPRNYIIDHIDRNRSNNKISNLRAVDHTINSLNRPIQKNSKSRISGVYWHKEAQKWGVQFQIHKQRYYLGLFNTIEEANCAKQQAELKILQIL